MRKVLLIFSVILVLTSCKKSEVNKETTLPFFNSSLFTPEWISKDSEDYNAIHKIPNFEFINQDGKKVTQDFYKGKIYVADFFFVSCPGICPVLTKNMNTLQSEYEKDKDVLLLSHTVMPWRDSVPVLKDYADRNNIKTEKWNLVTGDKDEIYDIARNAYFADEDFIKTQDKDAFIHTENFVLIDKKGRIRGVYNGTLNLEVKRLIKHINMLKKEG